jgi:hypothetical protein
MSAVAFHAPAATVRRHRAATVLALAAVGAALVAGLFSLGSGDRVGPLDWSGRPELFTHPTLPGDRVLTATLRNGGMRPVRLEIADVRLLDGGGRVVASTPVFLQGFGKSLWAAGRGPRQLPDTELLRTGRIALLKPGQEVPLTIAWHAADGDPVRVDYGAGSLALPR